MEQKQPQKDKEKMVEQKLHQYELEMKVRDYEVDGQGIVNNANYLHYLEHTRHEFCEHVGLTWREMNDRGWMPVVRKVEITYLSSLRMDDRFLSKLSITRKGVRFIFHQDIYKLDGTHVITAQVTVVSVVNGMPARGDELAEVFKDYFTE